MLSPRLLIALLCTLPSFLSLADSVVIYRWVDSNNVVHFSQHQPSHDNYTEITMSQAKKTKESQAVEAVPDTVATQPQPLSDANRSIVDERIQARCQEAKANIKTLTEFSNVQFTDKDGKVKVLTDDEKQQQLALSQKQVEVYCQDS